MPGDKTSIKHVCRSFPSEIVLISAGIRRSSAAKRLMPTLEEILAKSIPELKDRYVERERPVPKGLVDALENDSRQGAHHLAKLIRERWRKNRAEGQRLHNLLRFEIELWDQGFNFIAGVDEAGMAPLAGPLVAPPVLFSPNSKTRPLNNSKQILSIAVG